MADTSLQDRIRGHAMAVDGLLSLIPAKMYYGEDTSDQWSKKKQTKEEKKAAQRRNLDPDNERNKSVKEIMDERARKRKLEELEEQGDDGKQGKAAQGTAKIPTANKGTPQKTPKKAKADRSESNKKQKISTQPEQSTPAMPSIEESQQTPKKQAQVGKKADKKKSKASKVTRAAEDLPKQDPGLTPETDIPDQPEPSVEHDPEIASAPSEDGRDGHIPARDDVMPGFDFSGLAPEEDVPGDSSSQASAPQSPTFDISLPAKNDSLEPASATTSISSTVPPSEKPKHIKLPSDTSALRVRLAARIEALRAARKADGADGSPIRTRQELIESRRVKQAQRKAHKKELRQKAKEEEERKREEALASARTSPGSIMSPLIGMGTEDDGSANHLAFGRIAFGDGAQMSHDLSYVKDAKSKKGAADPKTALAKLEAQKKRISALDADKRKEVLEKETWLAARRRAEGEKIRDDEALLKKAVKRKEKAKKRSEREWKERAKGVEDAIKGRQKKREENLRKRRDDKLMGKGKKKGGAGGSKKGRAGFEGTFGGGKRK